MIENQINTPPDQRFKSKLQGRIREVDVLRGLVIIL